MNKNTKLADDEITKIINNPEIVTKAIQKGIKEALLKHKQAGHKVSTWRDGKVVWINPEDV